ncbi:MAG: D-amino-acid transaminase [Acetobacteraceae bacterium]|nr:D-amino-acid transaminase [Acetobacteraceae bacterium]
MSRIAYVNGEYLPHPEAVVNIEDRGYQFADGVYEVVYLNNGRFIDEDRHLDRLDRSLRELRIAQPMGRPALRVVLREVMRRNRIREGIVYMQITRGVARREHAFPAKPIPPSMVVTARRVAPYPVDVTKWTATAITHPDQRWERCDIKSTALLPNVLAKEAAHAQGAQEAILVDAEGMVTEGSSTNIWIVDKNGVLRTRPLGNEILPGCTRAALAAELTAHGIAFEESRFSAEDLRDAREVFQTSASSFVKPIVKLNGAPVGDGGVGPVAKQLFALFARHVQGGPRNAA